MVIKRGKERGEGEERGVGVGKVVIEVLGLDGEDGGGVYGGFLEEEEEGGGVDVSGVEGEGVGGGGIGVEGGEVVGEDWMWVKGEWDYEIRGGGEGVMSCGWG